MFNQVLVTKIQDLLAGSNADMLRLMNLVKKTDECWNWIGAVNEFGRGAFSFKSKCTTPQRALAVLALGELPRETLVLHTCDNKSCVRPEHLFLGTTHDLKRTRQNGVKFNNLGR